MTDEEKASFYDALDRLEQLDDSFSIDADGRDIRYMKITRNENPAEIVVRGNRSGLIHFARRVLALADSGFEGKHRHFDEVGGIDCDVPLVVAFESAEWDC